ncbi:MAG TPA: DUF1839 family protein [Candidatus Limnocylindria bacterium]|nr:DUF1839 family protein [Candidatus Limnocylindria bacterium]
MTVNGVSLFEHEPASYRPHRLHAGDRTYHETNCYTDILIELLHARGLEPLAMLGATARLDFEGDQWTFFKPSPDDLEALFGVDIHEMQPAPWLPPQIGALLAAGRTMTVELDAWFLPDTAATSYHREHVKTSVIPASIDEVAEHLVYFHNAGLYELSGEDFGGVFGRQLVRDDSLPPYAELVRFDAGLPLVAEPLRMAAAARLSRHLHHRPAHNPFHAFARQIELDLPRLLDGAPADYHAYAFATVRMAGAGFELLAEHVDWLLGADAAIASTALREIVDGSKVLGFKLARRRPFDPRPLLDRMAASWDRAISVLDTAAG